MVATIDEMQRELAEQEAACIAADRNASEARDRIVALRQEIEGKQAAIRGALDVKRVCSRRIVEIKRAIKNAKRNRP